MVDSDRYTVSSRILDRIDSLFVDEGDTVHEGQLMALLDDSLLKADSARGQATLSAANGNVALSGVNFQQARKDYDRALRELKQGIITREQFEHVSQAFQNAQVNNEVANANFAAADASLAASLLNLTYANIRSPANGTVARKWVSKGDVVQPSQPLYTLYGREKRITVFIEETKIGSIRLHAPVTIHVDTYKGVTLKGRVTMIGTAAASQFSLLPSNNAAGNFTKVTQRIPLWVGLSEDRNGIPPLAPGMSAEVSIRKSGDVR